MTMKTTTIRHTRFHSEIRKTVLAVGMLTLFLFYFVGGSLFTHAHRFDSAIVVHSPYYAHPWQTPADTTPAHSHSAEQFQTIQHLDYLIFTVVAAGLACMAFRQAVSISISNRCKRATTKQPHSATRGPPALD